MTFTQSQTNSRSSIINKIKPVTGGNENKKILEVV